MVGQWPWVNLPPMLNQAAQAEVPSSDVVKHPLPHLEVTLGTFICGGLVIKSYLHRCASPARTTHLSILSQLLNSIQLLSQLLTSSNCSNFTNFLPFTLLHPLNSSSFPFWGYQLGLHFLGISAPSGWLERPAEYEFIIQERTDAVLPNLQILNFLNFVQVQTLCLPFELSTRLKCQLVSDWRQRTGVAK